MFSFDLSCQHPFPCWKFPCTLPPRDALQHCAGLWPCCVGSSDSNLVLLLLFLPPRSTAARAGVFSFAGGFNVLSYVQRHRVCSLIEWIQSATCAAGGKVLSPPPQPHCPWVSAVAVSPPLPVRPPRGFAAEAALEGVGLPRAGRGTGGAAAGEAGPGAPGAQGNWRLGLRKGLFLASGSSAPVGIQRGGDTAACIMGTLGAPSVQGPQLSQLRELWFSQGLALASGSCSQSASVAGPSLLLLAPSPVKAVTGQPLSGVFHCPGLTCGDREAIAMAPWPVCDSSGPPCLHGCPGFLHRHFPLPPPPSHPLWRLPAVNN